VDVEFEESLEFGVQLAHLFGESAFAFKDDGDFDDELFNCNLVRGVADVVFAFFQGVEQWARASFDFDNFLDGNFGGLCLNVLDQSLQVADVSPIADVDELEVKFDLWEFNDEDFEGVVQLDDDFVLGEVLVFNNLALGFVDPGNEVLLDFNVQSDREVQEDLEDEAVLAVFPFEFVGSAARSRT
jgi:hypothetical protein